MSRAAIDAIIATRTDELLTECGCVVIPGPTLILLGPGKRSIFCPRHAWQKVRRNATAREVYNNALGLPLDTEPEPVPDIPPF